MSLTGTAATASQDAASSSYCGWVQPCHPLVRELFPDWTGGREMVLEQALEALRANYIYRSLPGRRGLDDLRSAWRSAPGRKTEANCLDLSCLLASCLRGTCFTADEAFVLLGGLRGYGQFHAWVLLREGPVLRWVDPACLEPTEITPARLFDLYTIRAIFNDETFYFLEAEKRRLLGSKGG